MAIKGFVLYSTYRIRDNKAYIHLYGRLESGKTFLTINEFKHYFFIRKKDLAKAQEFALFEFQESPLKTLKEENTVKIILNIPKEAPELRKLFEDNSIPCYEADIRFASRFLIDNKINGSVEISGEERKPKSTEHVDIVFEDAELKGCEYSPKLKILSFDIETSCNGDGSLYVISMICDGEKVIILKDNGKDNQKDLIKEYDSLSIVKDEKELIGKFKEQFIRMDPDIVTGWNVIDFDLDFLREKFRRYKITMDLGRNEDECTLKVTDNFLQDSRADFPGRVVLDGISLLKMSFVKLDDYKLGTAAKHFLGEKKLIGDENKTQEIDDSYLDDPKKLVEYNLKDSQLVIDILDKSGVIDLTILRSRLTGMQLDRVIASIASFDSLYLKELRKRGYVAPSLNFQVKETQITGGFVRESKPGIYDNILVLDFKSLYPSLMKTFNIDPLAYVEDVMIVDNPSSLVKAPNGALFKKEEGILPQVLTKLWKERDEAKKRKNLQESLAIKIIMNSFFGVLASPNCRFFSLEMANAITHFAQHFIKMVAERFEKQGLEVIYGDSVCKDTLITIKGTDSNIHFKKIHELFNKADKSTAEGKEYDLRKDISVLTLDRNGKSVFSKVKYIMRHKTAKQIYRVYFTNSWFIDVTEDHSLIGYINKQKNSGLSTMDRLTEVKPNEIGKQVRTIISLKYLPRNKIISKEFPIEAYEFMGLFIGDGSFNSFKKKNYYLYIAGGKDSKELVKKVFIPLQKEGYIKNYWFKKKGDLCLNGLKIINIMEKEFRESNKKHIPEFLLNESEENICAFLRGAFSADGTVILKGGKPIIRFTNTNDDFITKIHRMLLNVGISCSFFSETKRNKYKSKISKTVSKHIYIKDQVRFRDKIGFIIDRKNDKLKSISADSLHKRSFKNLEFDLTKVIKVQKIEYDDYVYDIEVENVHRFFANYVLVHNTDSIFINSKLTDPDEAEKLGRKIEKETNEFLVKYIHEEYDRESHLELEYEKLFIRFFMPMQRGSTEGSKKRYAGIKYLGIHDGKVNTKIDFTGLEFVRRDWTELAKQFQLGLMDRVFKKQEVVGFVHEFVKDLKDGKHDDLLVYRKAIRKDLEAYTKTTPPHVKAARLLDKIDSNIIEYLMTKDGPQPLQKLSSPVDYDHYIDKQVKPIADSVLVFFDKHFDDLVSGHNQKSLFEFGKK